jgi:hypothetical protein
MRVLKPMERRMTAEAENPDNASLGAVEGRKPIANNQGDYAKGDRRNIEFQP